MMIAPTPTRGDSGYSRLMVMSLAKHLPRRPIDDLPRFSVPAEYHPGCNRLSDVRCSALAGQAIKHHLDHGRSKISLGRDLGDVVVHPDWTVCLEELRNLIAKSCKPRHLLGIEGFEEAAGIVRFHALAQVAQDADRIRLGEGRSWGSALLWSLSRVLRACGWARGDNRYAGKQDQKNSRRC